jgi:hypothetical protein
VRSWIYWQAVRVGGAVCIVTVSQRWELHTKFKRLLLHMRARLQRLNVRRVGVFIVALSVWSSVYCWPVCPATVCLQLFCHTMEYDAHEQRVLECTADSPAARSGRDVQLCRAVGRRDEPDDHV